MSLRRVPKAITIPYPDLRQALRDVERALEVLTSIPIRHFVRFCHLDHELRARFVHSPVRGQTCFPGADKSAVDLSAAPVFMFFGKQFHRKNTLQLGSAVRVGVVLKDKCGNVVRDRRYLDPHVQHLGTPSQVH